MRKNSRIKTIIIGFILILAAVGVIWAAAGLVMRATPDYQKIETVDDGGEKKGGMPDHGSGPPAAAEGPVHAEAQKVETNTAESDAAEPVITEPETTEPEIQQPAQIKLLFSGDIYLSDHVLNAYHKAGGIHGVLDQTYLDHIAAADIFMVNEEFPFSSRGTAADKSYTFRLPPEKISMFQEMGIDIVTLANNHTLDFGREALEDTCLTLDQAGIRYVGAGNDLNRAKQLEVMEVQGKKIGFLGASRVVPYGDWVATDSRSGLFLTYDPAQLLKEIEDAREQCDYLVVYVHWGIERNEKPESYQKTMGRQYIDAGADLVIGSHPHVLQGIEFYNGKPIFYSMGNFVFGSSIPKTMLLQVDVSGEDVSISLIPGTSGAGYTRTLEDASKKREFYNYLESISFDITIDDDGVVHSKQP